MKTILTNILLLFILPAAMATQPVLAGSEYCYVSNVAHITDLSANLYDNTLQLFSNFEPGTIYEVTMYNIIGTEIFKQEFATQNGEYRFDIAKNVTPGMYIVGLAAKNDPSSKRVIKVLKQ